MAGLAVLSPTLHLPFVLDDLARIVENPDLADPSQLLPKLIYPWQPGTLAPRNDPSRPLLYLTYGINYALGRTSPVGYHLVNGAIHILNALLLFLVCDLLTRRSRGIALATALLFLVSPVNLATCAYIYGRGDLLAGLFMLSAVYFYLRAHQGFLLLSLGMFFLGLMTYPSCLVLPALLALGECLLGDGIWHARGRLSAFFGLAALYVLARFLYFGAIGDFFNAGKVWPIPDYWVVQPYVLCRYLLMLIVPHGLCLDHFITAAQEAWMLCLPALALFTVLLSLWGLGLSSSPSRRLIALGGLIFFLWVLPVTLFPTVDAMVERRIYFSSAGFYLALVCGAALLPRRFLRGALGSFAVLGCLALALYWISVARDQFRLRRDPITLWSQALELYPANPRATFDLALAYLQRGRKKEAVEWFNNTVQLMPHHYLAHYNLGVLLAAPESPPADPRRAAQEFLECLKYRPDFEPARLALGWASNSRRD